MLRLGRFSKADRAALATLASLSPPRLIRRISPNPSFPPRRTLQTSVLLPHPTETSLPYSKVFPSLSQRHGSKESLPLLSGIRGLLLVLSGTDGGRPRSHSGRPSKVQEEGLIHIHLFAQKDEVRNVMNAAKKYLELSLLRRTKQQST